MSIKVFDYATEMARAVAQLRAYAATTTLPADMPDELRRAVWLAVPHARWGRIGLGDEGLDQQMRLDRLAAYEYGGFHGYDVEVIDDWAEQAAFEWTEAVTECAAGRV